jgi:hypothetical protein
MIVAYLFCDFATTESTQERAEPWADEVQTVGGEVGPTYEVVISRTRYVERR